MSQSNTENHGEPRSSTEELKPCPFCGDDAEVGRHDSGDYFVFCSNGDCPVMPESEPFETLEAALAGWNRRAS